MAGINASHEEVLGHAEYQTAKEVETAQHEEEERESQEVEEQRAKDRQFQITTLWKPQAGLIIWFKAAGKEYVH